MKSRWLLCALLLLGAFRFAEAQNQVLDLDGEDDYVQLPGRVNPLKSSNRQPEARRSTPPDRALFLGSQARKRFEHPEGK